MSGEMGYPAELLSTCVQSSTGQRVHPNDPDTCLSFGLEGVGQTDSGTVSVSVPSAAPSSFGMFEPAFQNSCRMAVRFWSRLKAQHDFVRRWVRAFSGLGAGRPVVLSAPSRGAFKSKVSVLPM